MKTIMTCLASLALACAAHAQTWRDTFSQPAGSSLPGQSSDTGALWESAGPAGPAITLQAGNLVVPHLQAPAGNRVRLSAVPGPGARVSVGTNVTAGTFYYSLALRVSDLGALAPAGGALAGFNNATGALATLPSPVAARLLVRPAAGGYQVGLSKLSTNSADFVWAVPVLSTNEVVFVVAAYTFLPGQDNDTAALWLNPAAAEFGATNAPPPTLTATAGADVDQIQSFVLFQQPAPFFPGTVLVDEARAAGSWAPVTPPGMDFGDAPEAGFPYPTTRARNGARHGGGPVSLRFGANKDLETDGAPSAAADLDDLSGGPDDEDGIVFGGVWTVGGIAWVDISVSATGRVDGWLDWNRVAGWEPSEKVINNLPATPGAPIRFSFVVPAGVTPGFTYARFRLSTAGGLNPAGFAPDGEVQDYRAEITAPAAVTFNGLLHESLHGAQLGAGSNALSLTSTGGLAGMKVQLGESEGWAGHFQGLENLATNGAMVQFSAYGNTNGGLTNRLLSSVRFEGQGSNAAVFVDFNGLGATQFQAFFYDAEARLVASRTITPVASTPAMRLVECPGGRFVVASVFNYQGHWVIIADCWLVSGLPEDLDGLDIPPFNALELVPIVSAGELAEVHWRESQMEAQIPTPGGPGPILINDGVFKNGGLFTATGDAQLQVEAGGISAVPGSNSLGGLVLNAGPSGLSGGAVADSFDPEARHGGSLSLQRLAAPISNGVRWRASLTLRRAGESLLREVSANLTAINPAATGLTTDFSSLNATQVVVEVYQASNLVGTVTVPDGNLGTLSGAGTLSEISTPSNGLSGFVFSFDLPMLFTPTAGPAYSGDTILCKASSNLGANVRDRLNSLVIETAEGLAIGPSGIIGLDRGDATAAASLFDARHYTGTSLRLGANWDRESWGHATSDATGDDTHDADDEDGVVVLGHAIEGHDMEVQFTTTGTIGGWLSMWMDWNGDGDFADDGEFVYHWCGPDCYAEDVFSSISPTSHTTRTIRIAVPKGVVTSGASAYRNLRVRVSDDPLHAGDHSRYSFAGEVEDHSVLIQIDPKLDWDGHPHQALGLASMNLGSNGVQIGNIGVSGQDGVQVGFVGTRGNAQASFDTLSLGNAAARIALRWVAVLQAGRESEVGGLLLERTGNSAAFSASFAALGASNIQLQVLLNGLPAGSSTSTGSNVSGTVRGWNAGPLPALSQAALLTDQPDGSLVFTIRFGGAAEFTLPGLTGVVGDELRLVVGDARTRIDGLARLELLGANLDDFTILAASVSEPVLALQMALRNGQRLLQWGQPDALLQQGVTVAGPWNTPSNAAPGATVDTAQPHQFFRLVQFAARSKLAASLRQAELVFDGTVLAVEYRDSAALGTNFPAVPHTFVTFAVNQVLKGVATNGGTLTLRFAGGLGADGRLLRVKTSTLFDVGERSILFVRGNGQFASPLVNWAGGRFRLVNGLAYTEGGHELVSTDTGRLEIGAWRDLAEVRTNDLAGQRLEIVRSADVTEAGQAVTPPAGQAMSEAAFRQFLVELSQRVHTLDELQSLPLVPSANSSQPFYVPNPVPRRLP